jgi:hypothetical protein
MLLLKEEIAPTAQMAKKYQFKVLRRFFPTI